MNIDRFVLHLSLVSGVGIETIKKLVSLLEQYSIEEIYSFSVSDIQNITYFSAKKASMIAQGLAEKELLKKEEILIQQARANYISLFNPDYPKLLAEIHSPPPILYYKGDNFSEYANKMAVAIVGSRQGNYYAQQVVNHFVPQLIKQNACIVSGGAIGVDAMAHRATIQASGNTIVVLGSGLLHLYPYQNKSLFDEILDGNGIIATPFSMKTEPVAHNFPARNRIISGITSKTIIVQAAAKSGAYITAQCALEQGRDVFAVPGSIFEPLSAGCHALLSQGAQLADSVETILGQNASFEKQEKEEIPQISIVQRKAKDQIHSVPDMILYQCRKPMFFEELSEVIDTIDMVNLQKELCTLQLKGKLKQDISGAFITVTV